MTDLFALEGNCPAIGYIRVSTEAQVDGFGLPIQTETVTELAAARGLALAAIFADEGESGGEGLDVRDGLAAALNWLADHPGATLIIPRLDRLARDLMVQESILSDVWRAGCHVLSCSETEQVYCQPDSPDDPARTLIRQVLGAVAAYERAMIKLRMVRGRRRKIAEVGWAGGTVPYGWDDERELSVLRHCAAARGHGTSWQRIADQLNAAGYVKRSGNPWAEQELRRVYKRAINRTIIEPEALPIGQGALI